LSGDYDESKKNYQLASALDNENYSALKGTIKNDIAKNELQSAADELEMFNELQATMGKSAEVMFLNFLLSQKRGGAIEAQMYFLQEALDLQLTAMNTASETVEPGKIFEFVATIEPQFTIEIAEAFLSIFDSLPRGILILLSN
jgi:tetratricopeptide repeat protein 21B